MFCPRTKPDSHQREQAGGGGQLRQELDRAASSVHSRRNLGGGCSVKSLPAACTTSLGPGAGGGEGGGGGLPPGPAPPSSQAAE